MLSRFHVIPERYGRTDRQRDGRTDRQICYINIARMLTRDKNAKSLKVVQDHRTWHHSTDRIRVPRCLPL